MYFLFSVGFPIPYLGILEPNGGFHTMMTPLLDMISTKNVSLKKLPNPGMFKEAIIRPFVYQDFIYFIYANPLKPNVRFDIKHNNHKTLGKSYIPVTQSLRPKAVRIEHSIWFMGGKYFKTGALNIDGIHQDHNPLTSLWSFRKEKWYGGPNFKEHLYLFENPENLDLLNSCLVTLNRSTVFLITLLFDVQFMVSYNFVTKGRS